MIASIYILMALVMAPFLQGVANRTKAVFAGRHGQPLLQSYYDLYKLLCKDAVYSRTTTWIFRAGPLIGLSCMLAALTFLPLGSSPAMFHFQCDLVLFIYLFGVMRFFAVLSALDTGSSFEGMGASREVFFSTLAEPALFFCLAALARLTGNISLSGLFAGATLSALPLLALVAVSLFIVFLSENCRIPFDDPNTHLELTMIHEVMILDYGGPDLAFVLYAAALKFWILGGLIVNVFLSFSGLEGAMLLPVFAAGMLALAVAVGVVESVMARLRLLKVPQLLVGASVLAALAFALVLRLHP